MIAANGTRNRPKGVTILSVWSVIVGIGVSVSAVVAVYGLHVIPVALEAFVDVPDLLVAIALGITAVHFLMAYGLWNLRPWARVLAIAFAAVSLVFGLFTLPVGFASVLFGLATVSYLSENRVRNVFDER